MKVSLGIFNFFEGLSYSFFYPLFLYIDHFGRVSYLPFLFFGTLHSEGHIFSFLLCLLLPFFSQLFVSPPQTIILPFCISFSRVWFCSGSPVQCYEPLSIVLQALCLSDLIPWIYLSLSLYSHKGFNRSYLNGLRVFPTFFNLSLNLAIRSSCSEPQSFSGLVFTDYIDLLHLQLQRLLSIWFQYWPPGDVHGYSHFLCCWKMLFAMTSAFSWQNSINLCPASFCTPKPNLPVTLGISWLPTFAFQSPMIKRTSFFLVLVLEGLVGHHRTIRHHFLQY